MIVVRFILIFSLIPKNPREKQLFKPKKLGKKFKINFWKFLGKNKLRCYRIERERYPDFHN